VRSLVTPTMTATFLTISTSATEPSTTTLSLACCAVIGLRAHLLRSTLSTRCRQDLIPFTVFTDRSRTNAEPLTSCAACSSRAAEFEFGIALFQVPSRRSDSGGRATISARNQIPDHAL